MTPDPHCTMDAAPNDVLAPGRERESNPSDVGPPKNTMVAPTQDDVMALRRAMETALAAPFVPGNSVRPLRNGVEIFPAMLDAIRVARHTVEFETFVYWTGRVAEQFATHLAAAARRGVHVRILLDGIGCLPMSDEIRGMIEDSPAEVLSFNPPHPLRFWEADNRSHRKILVCDDTIGFTGGVGIAEEWEGDAETPEQWRETHFEVRGPAVRLLRATFEAHWIATVDSPGAEVAAMLALPSGTPGESLLDGDVGSAEVQLIRSRAGGSWSDARMLIRALVASARVRLRITTAYFVPEDDIVDLLCDASRRGVDVQIMNPGPYTDHRMSQLAGESTYQQLLECNVRIFRFQRSMLHVKVVTVDGIMSCIGSVNVNHRSLGKDDEVALNVIDRELTAALDADFDADLLHCRPVTSASKWEKRPLAQRLGEKFARVFRSEL